MKRYSITIVLVLFAIQIHQAQNFKYGKVSIEEVKETQHPLEPDADAAILYRDILSKFDYTPGEGFYATTVVHERIKIYKKEGFNAGSHAVRLYQVTKGVGDEVLGLKAVTYNIGADGTLEETKLKKDGIFDEETTEFYHLKKFTMPNLKEGSVVEFTYRIKSNLFWRDALAIQASIPVNKVKIRLLTPEYFVYKTHKRGWLPFIVKRENNLRRLNDGFTYREDVYAVDMSNVLSIADEPYTNNIDNYTASVTFELSQVKFPNAPKEDYAKDWEAVSKTIYDYDSFGKELEKTKYYEEDIDALLVGTNSDDEKMQRIFNFVKNKMEASTSQGKTAKEGVKQAYKEGVGGVGDINLMLTSMFRYAGLNANPILISTKANGVPIFPTRYGFNYVIAGIEVQDAVLLFDATDKDNEMNILKHKLLNWQGRIIRNEGSSNWVPLKPKKPATNNMMVNGVISADFMIAGTAQSRFSGHYNLEHRNIYKNLDSGEIGKQIEKSLEGSEIANVTAKNIDDSSKPIGLSYDFESFDAVENIDGKLYFSPVLFFGIKESPFKSEERKFPIEYDYAMKNRQIFNYTIPDGYQVETLPENMSFNLDQKIGGYKYVISQQGNKIQLSTEFAINEPFVPSDSYGSLKKFYELVVAKEAEKVVLTKI